MATGSATPAIRALLARTMTGTAMAFRVPSIPVPVDGTRCRRTRTQTERAIYATSAGTVSAAETEKLAKLWYKVHKEDHAMCVRLQAGRASDVATDGGVLSPVWENSVRHFQTLVLDALR